MFVFVSAATERSSNVRVVILSRWGEYFLLFPFVQPFQSCRLEIFRRHLFSDLSFLGGKHGKCLARSGCINYGPPLLTLQKSSTTKKLENKKKTTGNDRYRDTIWFGLARLRILTQTPNESKSKSASSTGVKSARIPAGWSPELIRVTECLVGNVRLEDEIPSRDGLACTQMSVKRERRIDSLPLRGQIIFRYLREP